jgi:hypothetical protein
MRLFKISLQPDLTIKEMGEWLNEKWNWKLLWRIIFFCGRMGYIAKLLEEIVPVPISKAVDSWSFELGSTYVFDFFLIYVFI